MLPGVLALSAPLLIGTFAATESLAQETPKKRVLHVDSYHPGNEWNDRIAAALKGVLSGQGVEVRVFHLDGKRRPSDQEKQASALEAKRIVDEFKPDVVTASDDDAAKFLLMPHFRDVETPFVFCGLNWDASVYGLPYRNTTGMVEVSPIPQIIHFLRRHARGSRVGFLAEDTETKRKELLHHERLFGFTYEKTYFVSTFSEWKDAYLKAQDEVDMLLVLGVGAVRGWDVEAAARFVEEASTIPSGTDFEWLMPVALLGVVKSPEEQGTWAAQAALRILEGVEPNQIPLTYNRDGELLFNKRIANRLEIAKSPPLARILP